MTTRACLAALSLLLALAQTPAVHAATAKPMAVGGQKDAHGCLTGAGYQYSNLRHKCLRIFEDGTRLEPVAAALPQGLSAFVLFKARPAQGDAELFGPTNQGPLRMTAVKGSSPSQWKAKGLVLQYKTGIYRLEDGRGQLLYKGPAAK